jgi:16S rRNA (uracil1498-N3)-methyltransferase
MSAPPRFFLAEPPGSGPPRLDPAEALHALRVLRLAPGDALIGLDGRGSAWPLRVVAATRRDLGLEVTGPAAREPEPGEPGAPLPFLEVAVAFPRRPRAEEMVRRLTQLGVARITPLAARQSGPQGAPEGGDERWLRLLQDACKQCGRAWLPELAAPKSILELALARAGEGLALLDPHQGMSLDTWARSLAPESLGALGGERALGTRARPIVLAIGPEGGFSAEERATFHTRGATSVRVSPHVLRIETAAEAALAIVAVTWMR